MDAPFFNFNRSTIIFHREKLFNSLNAKRPDEKELIIWHKSKNRDKIEPEIIKGGVMPDDILGHLVGLEDDLADFYEKLRKVSRLNNAAEVFIFLEEHSRLHARAIEGMAGKQGIRPLDIQTVDRIVENIKSGSFRDISENYDFNRAMDTLAGIEENIGKVYDSIADYYLNLSDQYRRFSEKIRTISGEERDHSRMILKRKI